MEAECGVGVGVARRTAGHLSERDGVEDYLMSAGRTLTISAVALTVGIVAFSLPATAAPPSKSGSYSCKGDKQLDVPMQFAATVESAGRVHVSAFGGSDKSGVVSPVNWRVYNASGALIDYFPRTNLAFVSPDMLKETNLEGLIPGASYTIELTSQDFCAHLGTVRNSVTMHPAIPETNPPVVSTPTLVQVGLQTGEFTQLQFAVTDDTGVQDVALYINGTKVAEYEYFDGVSIRWWCDPYPADAVLSVLEGPNYYVNYPTTYKGSYASVEVVVVDLFGNRSTSSAQLLL
jgi:hypothetical protein